MTSVTRYRRHTTRHVSMLVSVWLGLMRRWCRPSGSTRWGPAWGLTWATSSGCPGEGEKHVISRLSNLWSRDTMLTRMIMRTAVPQSGSSQHWRTVLHVAGTRRIFDLLKSGGFATFFVNITQRWDICTPNHGFVRTRDVWCQIGMNPPKLGWLDSLEWSHVHVHCICTLKCWPLTLYINVTWPWKNHLDNVISHAPLQKTSTAKGG